MVKTINFLAAALLLLTGWTAPAGAASPSLAAPTGKPILTISGKITVTNKNGVAQFDRSMLQGLGMVSFVTKTPWYKGPVKFEGVPLRKLFAAVGATGDRIVAIALNDYSVDIPMADTKKYNVILALKRDGQYMPISDKGPLFIVYPYDSDPELQSQKFYSRSAWQVSTLEVK